jgi:hypothetical protein
MQLIIVGIEGVNIVVEVVSDLVPFLGLRTVVFARGLHGFKFGNMLLVGDFLHVI